jgi:hypothetical protein
MTRWICSIAALALLVSAVPTAAQPASSEEPAILAVVDRFMHAVTTGDPAAMASIRLEGSLTTVESPNKAGGTQVQVRPPFTPRTAAPASTAPKSAVRERYWDPIVHVRGSLAVVWTPYEFGRDGKTSHCGVDVFEMVKQDGAWKIGNVMFTVEPDACPAMRPTESGRIRPTP